MNDINNMKKKKIVFKGVLIIGIILLFVIGYFSLGNFIRRLVLSSSMEATAISDNCHYDAENGEVCSPIYYYEVDGVQYQCKTNRISSLDISDSNNKVYYNPREPEQCLTQYESNASLIVYVALILPIAFIVVGTMNISRINQQIRKVEL